MPGTDPSTLDGYLAAYAIDADAVAGDDGSTVATLGNYAAPSGYAGPAIRDAGPNGMRFLEFSGGGKCLLATPPAWSPNPNNSGGSYPVGFSAVAVIRADTIQPSGESFPNDRRTFLGWLAGQDQTPDAGWSLLPSGRQACTFQHASWTGSWGNAGSPGSGLFAADLWYVVGMRTDGETLTLWKGLNFDRSEVNPQYVNGYSQRITGLALGAEYQRPGARDFLGDVAYFAPFSRALTDNEYEAAARWLLDHFGLPEREIDVTAWVGTTGRDIFLMFRDARTGKQAGVQSAPDPDGIHYSVNGGALVEPSTVLSRPWDPYGLDTPLISIPLASPIAPGAAVEVSVDALAIETRKGFVDAVSGVTATNFSGEAAMLSQEVPEGVTMRQGVNVNQSPSFWTPDCYTRNLFRGAAAAGSPGSLDADGYPLSGTPGTTYILRQGPATGLPEGAMFAYPGVEYGRYVVEWDGPAGSLLTLTAGNYDDGRTVVAHVEELDDLGGDVKRRYFDVFEHESSSLHCPSLNLVYAGTGGHCIDIKVMLARYEGEPGEFADQVIERIGGFDELRTMDMVSTNFSNIAKPEHFTPDGYATWGDTLRRTVAISRIEAYSGTHYLPDNTCQHWLVTFSAPHGLEKGQGVSIRSTGGNIDVVLADRTVNLDGAGMIGWPISSTTFYGFTFTPGGVSHAATVTAFEGSNAVGDVDIGAGVPIEAAARLVNEADIPAIHFCMPHAATEAAIEHVATRLDASLLPGKIVRLELSNEAWNLGFIQNYFFAGEAARLGMASAADQAAALAYARLSFEAYDVFAAKWADLGRDPDDLELVLGTQYGRVGFTEDAAAWVAANRPEVRAWWTFAPYHDAMPLGRLPGVDYSGWTLERMVDYHEAWKAAFDGAKDVADHVAVLDGLGLDYRLGNYESNYAWVGVSASTGGGGPSDANWAAWNREQLAIDHHPRMRGVHLASYAEFQAAGIEVNSVYSKSSGYVREFAAYGRGKYGHWIGLGQGTGRGEANATAFADEAGLPAWPTTLAVESPKGKALYDWQAAAGGAPPPLVASWGQVSSPRDSSISGLSLTFNRAVTGVGVGDVTLTRDGSPVSLDGASLTGSGTTYALAGLTSATTPPGVYVLRLVASGSGIVDGDEIALLSDAVRSWTRTGGGGGGGGGDAARAYFGALFSMPLRIN
jgi:hypothetical protein